MNGSEYGGGVNIDPSLPRGPNTRTPSLAQYSIINTPNQANNQQQQLGGLNTSSISFDLLNANSSGLKTRYDVKSMSGSTSLYGSRNTINNNPLYMTAATNPNGINTTNLSNALRSSTRRSRLKNYLTKKLFSEDTAYAEGEYEKNDYALSQMAIGGDKTPDKRENWSGRFDFFLSCLGYAVGLGAVWRFPYLCYKNGGGVFLIPYLLFLFLAGIPLFFIELNLGQYTSQGPILCWKMAPIFKGLGISMNIISFYFCIYYNMIIAYSLYYLFNSFDTKLAWAKCDWAWSSPSKFFILKKLKLKRFIKKIEFRKKDCTDDFGENFIVRCDQADVYRDMNGLCYNYSVNLGRSSIGWWDVKKRLEFRKPVLPSQDYY
jgi:hypothetical protein